MYSPCLVPHSGSKVDLCRPDDAPLAAWAEELMVLEAIYGPVACPPPEEGETEEGNRAARVDLQIPEGSLLAAVVAASSAEQDSDDSGDEGGDRKAVGQVSCPCRLEFLCPKGGSGDYPCIPPLIRVSCAALPATRRLARLAVTAAAVDQPMLHDLVTAAAEMLGGDWHQQQQQPPSQPNERPRPPLEESSEEEDEMVEGEEEGEEDWEEDSNLQDDDEEEEEVDPEAEAAAAAAGQAAAIDLDQQNLSAGESVEASLEGEDGGEAGASLVEDFDGLALGGDEEVSAQEADVADVAVVKVGSQGGKKAERPLAAPSGGSLQGRTGVSVRKGRPARNVLSVAAAEAEGRKLLEHQRWLEGSSEHGAMRQQRAALPAAGKREELLEMLERSHVVVISGATGCGKSTQVQYSLSQ